MQMQENAGNSPDSLPARNPHRFVLDLLDRPVLRPGLEISNEGGQAGHLDGLDRPVMLNETAAEILVRCRGQYSVQQIIYDFQHLFVGASEEQIEHAIREFLDLALERGWIGRLGRG